MTDATHRYRPPQGETLLGAGATPLSTGATPPSAGQAPLSTVSQLLQRGARALEGHSDSPRRAATTPSRAQAGEATPA
jgi:hypothetical protein